MAGQRLPEYSIESSLGNAIEAVAVTFASVDDAESMALAGQIGVSLKADPAWSAFSDHVRMTINKSGYVVVRGLKADGGRSLLILSAALGETFETFGESKIVKRFRMSPWTNELSHTIREGDFHTDGNVSTEPPSSTAIQCEVPDPGAPEFGVQRVAHLAALLDRLSSGDRAEQAAFSFLTESNATMAHERTNKVWQGVLVKDQTVRYHPHSLRVAAKRLGGPMSELDETIACVHRAALDVSVPFQTGPGDAVLVSNRLALHYRGACSVKFTDFPTRFESRSVLVLHLRKPGP